VKSDDIRPNRFPPALVRATRRHARLHAGRDGRDAVRVCAADHPAEFHWTASMAGRISSVTLVASAVGGIAAGILSEPVRTQADVDLYHPDLLARVGRFGNGDGDVVAAVLASDCGPGTGRRMVGRGDPGRRDLEDRASGEGGRLMQSGWALGLYAGCRGIGADLAALWLARAFFGSGSFRRC